MGEERKDNFQATLVAAIVVFCLVLVTVACVVFPIMLNINIKYTEIIEINDDLKDRIIEIECAVVEALDRVDKLEQAPKWYGDK